MRYKFAVVYGLQVPWLAPTHFGSNVHRALEVIHQRALIGWTPAEEEIESIVSATWISSPRISKGEDEVYQTRAVNQLQRYIREYGESLSRVMQSETSFSLSLDEHILTGKIDLIRQRMGNQVELVDFKTSEAIPVEVEGIDHQLDLYALGAEQSLGQQVSEQTVHFLKDGHVQTWEWSPGRDKAARDFLGGILECIARGDFPPQTSYCSRCQEFRDICSYAEP